MAFYTAIATKLRESLQESPIAAELRRRFQNLEPETQRIAFMGGSAAGIFVVLLLPLFLWWTAYSAKTKLANANQSIALLRSISDEMREVRQAHSARQSAGLTTTLGADAPLEEVAKVATQQGPIPEGALELKEGGTGTSLVFSYSRISLRQLVKVLYFLEAGAKGVAVNSVAVDAKDDTKGYLWATIAIERLAEPAPTKKAFTR